MDRLGQSHGRNHKSCCKGCINHPIMKRTLVDEEADFLRHFFPRQINWSRFGFFSKLDINRMPILQRQHITCLIKFRCFAKKAIREWILSLRFLEKRLDFRWLKIVISWKRIKPIHNAIEPETFMRRWRK